MLITHKSYPDLLETLKADRGLELRFTTRIVFINNLQAYMHLVEDLSDMADEVIKLSDETFCSGPDSIPDLKKVQEHLSKSRDKDIVIRSVGEYLRFARKYEASVKCLRSIMTLPAHSTKRVWIPIYAAKDIFQDVVGDLPEERYELYELDSDADEFECFVYSNAFSEKSGIVANQGLRQMFKAWDDLQLTSQSIAFSTKKLAAIADSIGNYSVHVVNSPFEYIQQHLKNANSKFVESLGSDAHWAKLSTFATSGEVTLEEIIERALNIAQFDAQQVVSSWPHLSDDNGFGMWLLWLWYKLGLTSSGDYLCFAIQRANNFEDIQAEIECAILDCISNPFFDSWVIERRNALKNMGVINICDEFWKRFDCIDDERTRLKLLSNSTHDEKVRIVEIVSAALKSGKSVSDYKSILLDKYPDLVHYLAKSNYLSGFLADYIEKYKHFKIMDYYDLSISEDAMDVDIFQFDTRSKVLNSIKCSKEAYFLWIDGMGIEWVDLLVDKVMKKSSLAMPHVEIGMAAMPTTTAANMAKADPDTVTNKLNQLDSLSHIKDKSDCNYFSIIVKQFELIEKISDVIVQLSMDHPGKSIVVTADHGMSRMAAKAFHEKSSVNPPANAEVENLGRYCIVPDATSIYSFAHVYKEENCLAFREHSHFTCSGYAPGEIHGGASPEEWLVPIITFDNQQTEKLVDSTVTYKLLTSEIKPDVSGDVLLKIKTSGKVTSLAVEIGTNLYYGTCSQANQWNVTISGLLVDTSYSIHVYLNNIFSKNEEKITIKRRGLDVVDDF